ncbi:MAG: glutamate--tRNA ligase [Acidobacteriota bacterium]
MNEMNKTVRFAPSPTGHLHIGGARTALFNYLFVKNEGGRFVLRIEDTDRERSSDEMSREIIEGLEWLGLSPDDPPWYQSDHIEDHTEVAEKLLKENRAYKCFCTQEETEARRIRDGKIQYFMYDRFCLHLSPEEVEEKLKKKLPYVVRFKVPEGETKFKDRIHKEVRTDNKEIDDFIILRSDGTPTYQLSVVSDDIAMNITDVVRGDDHISNTFKQILIFLALGKKPPRYSHLPLIMGADKKKLSKRHGETSILEFKKRGYLPEALVTYLSHLSWSPNDHKKIYNLKELSKDFKFSAISKNSPIFDYDKLNFLNAKAIKEKDPVEILELLFEDKEFATAYKTGNPDKLISLISLVKPRMKKVYDFIPQFKTYLSEMLDYDEEEFAKLDPDKPELAGLMAELLNGIKKIEKFNGENVEIILREIAEKKDVKAGGIIHPLRFALTNTTVSPSIFEIIEFLGKEKVLKRINGFIYFLK